jgi:hypothetical protein
MMRLRKAEAKCILSSALSSPWVSRFVAFAVTPSAQGTDPLIGTWKLNVAKSRYDPGPAPKSQTVTYEAWENGLKLTADGTDAEGRPTHSEYAAKFDGKDYTWKGNPDADTVALKRVNDRTVETIWKKDGKMTITSHSEIARDGKTRRVTQKGRDGQGRTVSNSLVYEKQ